MSELTLQMIFDRAWQAFVVEKKRPGTLCSNSDDVEKFKDDPIYRCHYLTEDGRRCAIGHSLPEDVARDYSGSNSAPWFIIVRKRPELFHREIREMVDDFPLAKFQGRLHDRLIDIQTGEWSETTNLEEAYRQVATDYNLTVPEVPA